MADEEQEDTRRYVVVVNHEEQYSIWLDGKALPNGWRAAGKAGMKGECLAWVKEVWTDMTPASLRAARPAKG
jgi:MbtH protein